MYQHDLSCVAFRQGLAPPQLRCSGNFTRLIAGATGKIEPSVTKRPFDGLGMGIDTKARCGIRYHIAQQLVRGIRMIQWLAFDAIGQTDIKDAWPLWDNAATGMPY